MAFWRVAGFSQPSPVDQILDKEEYTLEELLDEDDLIQECKSLNGRLVAFLRERSTVEQLIRFLVDPPLDADDPKRAFKYPFASCEVFCCEVEAMFNTLLEDTELMALLFSLLDAPGKLNSKTAGYFGRVVGTLLLRKTNEMMQFLQNTPSVLENLVNHVDTASIAEIIKRIVGADEQSNILFMPQSAEWLAATPLVDLLLGKLAESSSSDAQANAADILSAVAHTQPSPIASKLTKDTSISALFSHALAPGKAVLVPALDVCIALIEPRRTEQATDDVPMADVVHRAKVEAVDAIVQHLPKLGDLLHVSTSTLQVQHTQYGQLSPPLGRARLRVVELLAVLLRSGSPSAESAVMAANAVQTCLNLFAQYPFNNMLHSHVVSMLVAILTKASDSMLQHLFEHCKLLSWLSELPIEVQPTQPEGEEEGAAKASMRAGYMGHVTQIGNTLESFARQQEGAPSEEAPITTGAHATVPTYLEGHTQWKAYVNEVLNPRLALENTATWQCGRPQPTDPTGIDSDNDEFQAQMELEHMVGMQPALYHRYDVVENDDDDDDDDDDLDDDNQVYKAGSIYETQRITEAISNIDLNTANAWHDSGAPSLDEGQAEQDSNGGKEGCEDEQGQGSGSVSQQMEDDEVLLATSDDEESSTSGNAAGGEDMVVVEEEMADAGSGAAAEDANGAVGPKEIQEPSDGEGAAKGDGEVEVAQEVGGATEGSLPAQKEMPIVSTPSAGIHVPGS